MRTPITGRARQAKFLPEELSMHLVPYIEAATDHELCYCCYITMDEQLNAETDERVRTFV